MNYNNALRGIRSAWGLKNILVTGPQRSGTTIIAHVLACDLGLSYVDENDIGWIGASENDTDELRQVLEEGKGNVIQSPACTHICHTLPDTTAVVFCMREVEDIIASQERVGWNLEHVELEKYPEEYRALPVAETKYAYWWDVQIHEIKFAFEIEYESLRGHPLWKNDRDDFEIRQWK